MWPPTSPASMRAARSAQSDSREKSTPTRIRIRPRATFGSYPFTRAIGTTRATRRESPSETAATSSRNDAAESCGEFLFASSYMSPRASPLRRPAESDGAGATLTKGGCHACCSGGNRPEDPAGRFARTLVELADGGAGQVTGEFVTYGCRNRPDRPPHARMGRAPARPEDPLHSLRRVGLTRGGALDAAGEGGRGAARACPRGRQGRSQSVDGCGNQRRSATAPHVNRRSARARSRAGSGEDPRERGGRHRHSRGKGPDVA